MNVIVYLVPVFGIIALLYTAVTSAWVTRQNAGDANMIELAGFIAKGAMAFLKAEWRILGVFVALAAVLLAWAGTTVADSSPIIALAFIIGAICSATAGYIGMRIATRANVRTTQAARTSLSQALKVSFKGGSVMGLGVAGLAVLGLSGLFIILKSIFAPDALVNSAEMLRTIE